MLSANLTERRSDRHIAAFEVERFVALDFEFAVLFLAGFAPFSPSTVALAIFFLFAPCPMLFGAAKRLIAITVEMIAAGKQRLIVIIASGAANTVLSAIDDQIAVHSVAAGSEGAMQAITTILQQKHNTVAIAGRDLYMIAIDLYIQRGIDQDLCAEQPRVMSLPIANTLLSWITAS